MTEIIQQSIDLKPENITKKDSAIGGLLDWFNLSMWPVTRRNINY